MTKGYHNYRGRGGRQKRLLAVVLVLFIVLFVLLTCRSYSRGKCNVVR